MDKRYNFLSISALAISVLVLVGLCFMFYRFQDLNSRIKEMELSINNASNTKSAVIDAAEKYLNEEISEIYASLSEMIDIRLKSAQTAVLDPTSRGFVFIRTDSGEFIVKLVRIKPYMNGYIIELAIGNPNSIQYKDFTVHLKYSMSLETYRKTNKNLFGWIDTFKTKDAHFTEVLRPEYWTQIEIPIVPASAEQLEHIEMTLDVESLLMKSAN